MSVKRPKGELLKLTARNRILEDTLTKVWEWSSIDGEDVAALRNILRSADEGTRVMAALDAIGIGGTN